MGGAGGAGSADLSAGRDRASGDVDLGEEGGDLAVPSNLVEKAMAQLLLGAVTELQLDVLNLEDVVLDEHGQSLKLVGVRDPLLHRQLNLLASLLVLPQLRDQGGNLPLLQGRKSKRKDRNEEMGERRMK